MPWNTGERGCVQSVQSFVFGVGSKHNVRDISHMVGWTSKVSHASNSAIVQPNGTLELHPNPGASTKPRVPYVAHSSTLVAMH